VGFETAARGLLNHRWAAQGSRQARPTNSGNSTDESDLDLGRHHKEHPSQRWAGNGGWCGRWPIADRDQHLLVPAHGDHPWPAGL